MAFKMSIDTPLARAAEAAINLKLGTTEKLPSPKQTTIITIANQKGGKVLAIKGEKAQEELENAQKGISFLKDSPATIATCGLALDLSVTVVQISKR